MVISLRISIKYGSNRGLTDFPSLVLLLLAVKTCCKSIALRTKFQIAPNINKVTSQAQCERDAKLEIDSYALLLAGKERWLLVCLRRDRCLAQP
jgi:hypothetical protein